MRPITQRRTVILGLVWVLILTPALSAGAKDEFVQVIQASGEVPEESLLDLGIQILDPGLDPEKLAKLEPQKGSKWHAYRRKWATERKHLPDVDVAEAGGWKTLETLKTAYQQADAETMLLVVLEPRKLRDVR